MKFKPGDVVVCSLDVAEQLKKERPRNAGHIPGLIDGVKFTVHSLLPPGTCYVVDPSLAHPGTEGLFSMVPPTAGRGTNLCRDGKPLDVMVTVKPPTLDELLPPSRDAGAWGAAAMDFTRAMGIPPAVYRGDAAGTTYSGNGVNTATLRAKLDELDRAIQRAAQLQAMTWDQLHQPPVRPPGEPVVGGQNPAPMQLEGP